MSELCTRWQEADIIVPRYKLARARSPDGIRLGARDERVDYNAFHDRKSMHKLKSDGIEDEGRENEHDKLSVERRESQGLPIASSTFLYLSLDWESGFTTYGTGTK